MQLANILSGFSKVKNQLTDFIEDQSAVNKKLEEELQVGVSEVKQAGTALKQINKIVGK